MQQQPDPEEEQASASASVQSSLPSQSPTTALDLHGLLIMRDLFQTNDDDLVIASPPDDSDDRTDAPNSSDSNDDACQSLPLPVPLQFPIRLSLPLSDPRPPPLMRNPSCFSLRQRNHQAHCLKENPGTTARLSVGNLHRCRKLWPPFTGRLLPRLLFQQEEYLGTGLRFLETPRILPTLYLIMVRPI